MKKKKQHGGKRPGSGPKKTKEATKVMRIRLSKVAEVEALLKSD